MSEKSERDWSEIIEEARAKAKNDISGLVDEISPKVKELVEKARKANFREEADELLARIRKIAEDLSERGKSSTSTPSKGGSGGQTVRAIFQNPGNPDETYASRGPKPKWMKDLEKRDKAALRKAITNWDELEERTKQRFED